MWLLQALILHILFLGSIFVIYFRSPVLTNLTPKQNLENPPARRLVLIVTDGLRASSFFKDKCKHIPHIRKLFLEEGILGISHTRVPTESRPGHIALIAGLYEDPSAVTRGWKYNPIDFDSVFNRSSKTRAWGANDILSIFAKCTDNDKMDINSYTDDLDFSGKDKTYMLDEWVFSRVEKFLAMENSLNLKSEERVIYFLHLLGLDSSGHIHKPNTDLFYENLNYTERKIYEIYEKFEKVFDDKLTSYILTSDHGMTDSGSHGAGDLYETETPLFVWGAGIKNWKYEKIKLKQVFKIERTEIPLVEVEQADIAPLMSSLIGVSTPMNNYGKLPINILNTSDEYTSKALMNNAEQILAQYEKLLDEFDSGLLSQLMPRFMKLEMDRIQLFKNNSLEKIQTKNYNGAIKDSNVILDDALEGIEYYQKYYQTLLLFCTTLAILGWIVNLLIISNEFKPNRSSNLVYICAFLVLKIPLLLIHLQGISASIGIYILLPIVSWSIPLHKLHNSSKKVTISKDNFWKYLQIVIGSEFLILSFVWREIISIVFVLFSMTKLKVIYNDPKKGPSVILKWIFLTIIIALFPLFRGVNGNRNDILLGIGVTLWIYKLLTASHLENSKIIYLFFCLEILNTTICIYNHNKLIGIPTVNLIFSWTFFLCNLIIPLTAERTIKPRLESILICFSGSYLMLSVSYEPIFLILLITHLQFLMEINTFPCNDNKSSPKKFILEEITTQAGSLQLAFTTLLYTILSFFGTGNIASVSSFDINIIRCFVTTFSPFVIMILVVLKLAIPIVLILGIIIALTNAQVQQKKIFLSILIICNLMCITSLFMVTNKGSWLEIGSSISRFVIMQVTTLVLFLISGLVVILFRFKIDWKFLNFTKKNNQLRKIV